MQLGWPWDQMCDAKIVPQATADGFFHSCKETDLVPSIFFPCHVLVSQVSLTCFLLSPFFSLCLTCIFLHLLLNEEAVPLEISTDSL